MTTTRQERLHRAMCKQSRWYDSLQEHRGLMEELLQAHLDLLKAVKPAAMGGPTDALADIAAWQLRDAAIRLCDAVGLDTKPEGSLP